MIEEAVADLKKKVDIPIIGGKFHIGVVRMIKDVVLKIKEKTGIDIVVLSGGVFLNKIVSVNTSAELKKSGMKVFMHGKIPTTDVSISLGQAVAAAERG